MKPSPLSSLAIYRFLWVWLTLLIAIWLGWHALAQVNFLYPLWHDHAGIGANIEQYAPKNLYRKEFELTDPETRFILFQGIVEAIHNHGQGLAELSYSSSRGATPLLHKAEIIHLQDVANLIDFLNRLAFALSALWLFISWRIYVQIGNKTITQTAIRSRDSWLNLTLGLAILIGGLLLIGAKKVFYQLHIWIFPDEHQWFFYYQESLMSTMMKAPDLFAWIASSLLLLALLIYLLLQIGFNRIAKHGVHQ